MDRSANKYTIVGLGEVLWDVLPDGKQLGGAPCNFAYHSQALGGRGMIVSSVGDDDLGREILSRLNNLGLDCRYISVDSRHPTSTVTVELDNEGKPNFTIHGNVAWDFLPVTEELLLLASRADAVCFGSLGQRSPVSRNTIRRFLQNTKPQCLRVFDINIRQSYYNRETVHSMLELSEVLKLNGEEVGKVAELLRIEGGEDRIMSELLQTYDLKLIALTKGSKGSRLYTGSADSWCDSVPPSEIVDTVGAGDAFSAATVMGLLEGRDLDRINEHANRVASYVCSRKGATPELPSELVTP